MKQLAALLLLPVLAGCSMLTPATPTVLPVRAVPLTPEQTFAVQAVVAKAMGTPEELVFGDFAVGAPRTYGQNGKPAAPICGVVGRGAVRAVFLVWYNNDENYVLAGLAESGPTRAAILGQCLNLGTNINPNAPLIPPPPVVAPTAT